MSESMIEVARRAAREYIDHQIAVIKDESPYYIWDVCPWAYELAKGDSDTQDHLFELICEELSHASISYVLQGESARDAEIERQRVEVARLELKARAVIRAVQLAANRLVDLENDTEGASDGDSGGVEEGDHAVADRSS